MEIMIIQNEKKMQKRKMSKSIPNASTNRRYNEVQNIGVTKILHSDNMCPLLSALQSRLNAIKKGIMD